MSDKLIWACGPVYICVFGWALPSPHFTPVITDDAGLGWGGVTLCLAICIYAVCGSIIGSILIFFFSIFNLFKIHTF